MHKKNILLIMPFFFNYESAIKMALQKKSYCVYPIDEDFDRKSFIRQFKRIYFGENANLVAKKYYWKQLKKCPTQIDYILIIKGRTLTSEILQLLKNKYSNAKFIMYQWDSVALANNAMLIAENCEKRYTFDPIDALTYHWTYRPLFYSSSYKDRRINKRYDISFIFSIHSQRVKILKAIEKYTSIYDRALYSYAYSNKWVFMRQKYLKKNPIFNIPFTKVNFQKLSFSEMNSIYDQTFAILDYKFPEQNGLTMRSIEALGHRCKLITNNENIIHEPFYNPNNIYIYKYEDVKENGFNIPSDFFTTPYQDIAPEILHKYTIDGWIDDVLGEEC